MKSVSKIFVRIASVLFVLGVILLVPRSSYAQRAETTLSPSFYHLVTNTDIVHEFDFSIENSGDPQVHEFKLVPLGNPDINGNLYPLELKTGPIEVEIAHPTIRFGERFLMRTGDKEEIPVEIFVPLDTPPGEYMFSIVAQARAPVSSQGRANISIKGGSGILLIVTVTNDNIEKKDIETSLFKAITGFTIPWGNSSFHIVDTGTPVPLSFIVKNSGNFIAIPQGEVLLTNQAKEVQRFGIVPSYIYPQSQRVLTTAGFNRSECLKTFTQSLCQGNYATIFNNLPTGLYEVTAQVSYGEPSPVIYNRDYFIVIPLPLIGGIIVLVSLAVGILSFSWYKLLRSKRHHR